eukprot:TRINITY_DN19615_c0_g1_i1.p1 TRINITY_DN19615_c0_g1~~TRINITY_DN19615_c0_g1_i1.p1  ORF type:complete len:230 (+),score=43.44 TRINITY_DN19615_c0_g1_i1:60-749(+)
MGRRYMKTLLSVAHAAAFIACEGATVDSEPEPTPWPEKFHAAMHQNRSGDLADVDLYYDWEGGRNLHIVRREGQLPFYDNERQNGSTYFYTKPTGMCKSMNMGIGLLPPDWLRNATYLGKHSIGDRDCNAWQKGTAVPPHTGPFITYYADAESGIPVRWVFFDGAVFDVLGWHPGGAPNSETEWQMPASCFSEEDIGGVESGDIVWRWWFGVPLDYRHIMQPEQVESIV